MGRKRVLVIIHTGEVGGAERAMLRLMAASDAGFDIRLVALADGPLLMEARRIGIDAEVVDGGDVVRLTRAETGRLGALLRRAGGTVTLLGRLRAAVRAAPVDLVVANSLKSAVLYSLVPGPKPPWVWHLHDRLTADYLPRPISRALRLLARVPRAVIANSVSTGGTAGRPRRLIVASPGVESLLFDGPVEEPDGRPVGMLGRVSATKGQREFVASAALIGKAHPEATFRIVGDALFEDRPYAQALRQVIDASPVGDRIEWRGWSDDPAATLRGFGVFVHASPVPEPFGQVIVEAMAVGTPVIATDAGGAPEIVDPRGEARDLGKGVRQAPYGLLVTPGDPAALAAAVARVLDDHDAAADTARRAREHARENFTIERTWATVAEVWSTAAR
jgi:glycosyltransferase involved in cell wall biosynthesis